MQNGNMCVCVYVFLLSSVLMLEHTVIIVVTQNTGKFSELESQGI
jgi:hypothetical protein